MYYVYEFYNVNTGEILYAGKGTGNRYKTRSGRNQLLTEMLGKFQCDSRIVKKFLNEKDAFEYEYNYIKMLKGNGQCVCNIHSGGAGGSGEYWTDELRKEYSKNNVMKSKKQRKRMAEHNPMSNPKIAEKVNGKKRKPVIIGGKEYSSIKEAKEKLHTSYESIVLWCKKGINFKGEKCYFKGQTPVEFKDTRYNKGGCRPLTYSEVHYESVTDLAKELNCSANRIYYWLKRGFTPDGIPCRYDDDKRELVYKDIKKKKGKNKPIIINGVKYNTCKEASKILGIRRDAIYCYATGRRKSSKYICEYDNQQPSQENTI